MFGIFALLGALSEIMGSSPAAPTTHSESVLDMLKTVLNGANANGIEIGDSIKGITQEVCTILGYIIKANKGTGILKYKTDSNRCYCDKDSGSLITGAKRALGATSGGEKVWDKTKFDCVPKT
jgi:hypothetical protein